LFGVCVLFFTGIICFIASFDNRLQFHKQFGAFFKSAVTVEIPFIIGDIFTTKGDWWFNTDYTLGINIAGLPLEEWFFFYKFLFRVCLLISV